MNVLRIFRDWWRKKELPIHLQRGRFGEAAAEKYLRKKGLKFLTRNFKGKKGEIDLVFRERDCLVFVEVKTRSSEDWCRPAAAVNLRKREALMRTASNYVRQLKNRQVKFRFDIVEVLLETETVREIRHLPNCFSCEISGRQGMVR